jgi:hypothetical protein
MDTPKCVTTAATARYVKRARFWDRGLRNSKRRLRTFKKRLIAFWKRNETVSRKKSRFCIGQYVTVQAICKMEYESREGIAPKGKNNANRIAHRVPCRPFNGLIVGARYRMLGRYNSGGDVGNHDGYEYEPPYLSVKGSVLVWLVARGMTNHPVEVLDEDVEPAGEQQWPPYSPWRFQEGGVYDAKYRLMLSEEARAMPRAANGRFLSMLRPNALEAKPCQDQ